MSGTGEERRRADRAQQVALFRYQLIREAADPALSTRQRGRLARELAAPLKREKPGRTAAQVERILRAHCGWSPSVRTLQRHFERLELAARPGGAPPVTFGRFEAARPNELWTGDALHGPHAGGRKTFLFAFLDDHSRAVMAARWGYFEDTVRLAAALRPALAARGIPESIYVDYAGTRIMPSLARRGCSPGVNGQKVSA